MSNTVSIETAIPFSGQRDGFAYKAHFVTFTGFRPDIAAQPPHALVFGQLQNNPVPLVRTHSGCRTGDTFGSKLCDCGQQLTDSLRIMSKSQGVLLYLPHQEGRGIGLNEKIKAYDLMRRENIDTYTANERLGHFADERDYSAAAQMITALGITKLRLLTGNPLKAHDLEILGGDYGFKILEQIPMERHTTPENARYLEDKELRGGHEFSATKPAPTP